jgi:hypothetical protein
LFGNPVDSTAFGTYVSAGTVDRVYTIASPFTGAEVFGIKYAQAIDIMILCHPNHAPLVLTIVAFDDWTIAGATFGTTIAQPVITSFFSTLSSGAVFYSYVVTAISADGDESIGSIPVGNVIAIQDLRTTPGSNSINWLPVAGAVSYNVYKSDISYFGAIPAGVPYGFIGNVTGNQLIDSNILADFSITPPVGTNPFTGSGLASITQTSAGTITTIPSVSIVGGSPNAPAIAQAQGGVQGTPTVGAGGTGYAAGDTISLGNGVIVVVDTVSGGAVTSFFPINHAGANPGLLVTGAVPSNPVAQLSTSGVGTGATVDLTWGVQQTILVYAGVGYVSTPTVHYSSGSATATATLAAATSSNPSVPGFFQQRLALGAASGSPETIDFSQPGSYFNYNVSSPIQADDAISATLASGSLETIKSFVPTSVGLIIFTDVSSWLMTGGQLGSAISPSAIVANRQSLVGATDVPPLLINFDVLYCEFKGSAVRDANYNYYAQIFTGSDISAVSSQLFYGFQITQWTWALAPFRIVWAVRNDGVLLALTFAKEEEFMAWTHHVTNGTFNSVTSIPETVSDGMVLDTVYVVVGRTINGVPTQYIERFSPRILGGQVKNAWAVDAGLQYSGAPTTNFIGAQHLAGETVTGLADGQVIPPFTMPASGNFTLSTPASLVTIGLGFECNLQTLPIDTGEPTIQTKEKKESLVTVRCVDTLGLEIGTNSGDLVPMKDLIIGNVGSMTNELVTDLVTGDARTAIDPAWTTTGQFYVRQSQPLPATITGVIPQLTVGDTPR